MTEIEICEQAITALHDRRNIVSKRINELAGERQCLGFAAYVDGDQASRIKLDKLNAELAGLADESENIKAALAEADRRLADARKHEADADAKERTRRALALLVELEACGPAMDRMVERPEGGLRRVNDPPSRVKISVLLASLFVELRALGVTEARFPAMRYDVCAWQDLRKAILDTLRAGWPGPAQRLLAADRDSFVGLLGAFARIIRSNLGEQINSETEVAA